MPSQAGENPRTSSLNRPHATVLWLRECGGSPVTVKQYPTTYYYDIPEPSSIVALVMGIGALGFGALRRVRK